jgi:hypothetical protein
LVALDEAMPLVGAYLMMAKGHPLFTRINQSLKRNRNKLAAIERKYKVFAERFDKCSQKGRNFRALRKFLKGV